MENYTVLLSEEVTVPVTEIAAPLGEALGRPTAEVTRGLRASPWILVRDVPPIKLDEIFDILAAAKVPAKAVPDAWLPTLAPPLRVTVADTVPKGLFLQNAEPPAPPVIPWTELVVLSAGLVTHDGEDHLLVDLVGTEDKPCRLRISATDFSHEYLGDRMKTSSRENFRLFLDDIRGLAPDAYFTLRTECFRRGDPTSSYRFRSIEAYDDYIQWVLQALAEEEEEEVVSR